MTPLKTPGHSRASLGQSLVGSLFLCPGSWCTKVSVCVPQESISPVLCKFWQLYGGVNGDLLQEGLCHTQVWCTQPYPSLLPITSRTNTPQNVLFIIGDWNAKVGRKEILGVTGKFGLGVQNEAGQRLIESFAEIMQTRSPNDTREDRTWTSPDGQHRNQIEYTLCSQRWRSSIQSAKTRPGTDCDSDHELLIAKFRLKLKYGKPLDHSGMT